MTNRPSHSPSVHGLRLKIVVRLLMATIFLTVLRYTGNWRKAKSIFDSIRERIKQYRGPKTIQKVAYVKGRYYWDMYGEGWPSKGLKRNVVRECKRIERGRNEPVGMRNVLFGITTKCPLQCDHCYEWDILNTKEVLSNNDLHHIIGKLVSFGVGQIHLGGGEPMMRYDAIVKLIEQNGHRVGFWIVTSGYGFTQERARQLKRAGLTGVCVSLDNHQPHLHARFRNHPDAYKMAEQAVAVSNKAGLVTALSLCTTREYTTRENLMAYATLARSWGVSFIQLLEPKSVGHYKGLPVRLVAGEKAVLTDFFLRLNNDPKYRDYPIAIYHEYYQSTLGCRGAGQGAFYIDPRGVVHPCPFCRNGSGNLVEDSVEDCLMKLRKTGCPAHADVAPKVLHEGSVLVQG